MDWNCSDSNQRQPQSNKIYFSTQGNDFLFKCKIQARHIDSPQTPSP